MNDSSFAGLSRVLTLAAGVMISSGAFADDKLPTDYGDPANDIQSGSVYGLTWTGAARSYRIGDDVVLVFTDTIAGNCSFTIADGYQVDGRYLLVGGGGPGGNPDQGQMVGGGGAGGGVADEVFVGRDSGTYSVTVGNGGTSKGTYGNPDFNNNGTPSFIQKDGVDVLRVLGGGGGGVANNQSGDKWKFACGNPYGYCTNDNDTEYDFSKIDVANGGGAAFSGVYAQHPGKVGDLGYEGGSAVVCGNTFDGMLNAGGGAGAGENGHNATGYCSSGAGGKGKVSNITGEDVCYGGGGAGGTCGSGAGVSALVKGGEGGGGRAYVDDSTDAKVFAENGVDGLGGGGAGFSLSTKTSPRTRAAAGRGGNGVVIVRFTKIEGPKHVEGLDFGGAAEWFNIGEGEEKETVVVFTNTAANVCWFKLASDANVRLLLVGGGGAGSWPSTGNFAGAGGGAGGFVEANDKVLARGVYKITVGKGGEPKGDKQSSENENNSGSDSVLTSGAKEIARALGGGAAGIPNGNNRENVATGKDGGSGGGAGGLLNSTSGAVGKGLDNQGSDGGLGFYINAAGGGGGAGGPGAGATGLGQSGAGGEGKTSDITGATICYAGGGAGGAYLNTEGTKIVSGGNGGGGSSKVVVANQANVCSIIPAVDGLGGGGAGAAGGEGYNARVAGEAGRGGNGVVILRVKKFYEPLPCVSFTGEAEWYNIGCGKTRETVIIYTNVNEVGTLTLGRRATARILLVGGGGAGGSSHGSIVGSGGGAGGFVEVNARVLARGDYKITVGKGGEAKILDGWGKGDNGGDSIISFKDSPLLTAKGGGAGGSGSGNQTNLSGANGGSGGGASKYNESTVGTVGAGSDGQGKAGGAGVANFGGGGGGAGEGGGAAASALGGKGGDGKESDITGDPIYYAGGGAGGSLCTAGQGEKYVEGGLGGGGYSRISSSGEFAAPGTDGLGGGGAGAPDNWNNQGHNAGRGGNGVVIVRITEGPDGLLILLN